VPHNGGFRSSGVRAQGPDRCGLTYPTLADHESCKQVATRWRAPPSPPPRRATSARTSSLSPSRRFGANGERVRVRGSLKRMLIHDKSPRRAALADQPRPRAQGATDIGGSENVDQAAHPQLGGHKFVRTRFTTTSTACSTLCWPSSRPRVDRSERLAAPHPNPLPASGERESVALPLLPRHPRAVAPRRAHPQRPHRARRRR